jgi:hypothetical protein
MGQKGKVRLEANFTVEQMAKQNEDYYYRLLEQSRRMSHGAGSHLTSE